MFTWSLGWIGSWEPSVPPTSWMHRLEMTSLTFMFDWVPDPVCHTYSGNSVSSCPADHLIAHPLDQLRPSTPAAARPGVDHGGGLFHVSVGVVHLLRHPVMADVEMLQAALGLRAPVLVRGHLDFAQAVELSPHSGGVQPYRNVEDLRCLTRSRSSERTPFTG